MEVLSIIAFFGSFALAGVAANLLATAGVPRWVGLVTGPPLLALFYWLHLALPFRGFLTEIPLFLLAAATAAGPIHAFLGMNRMNPKPTPVHIGVTMVFCLVCVAGSIFSLLSRANAACWLAWSCDGTVAEVYRDKGNHANPTLVVEAGGKKKRFQPVDFDLFEKAKPGQRLVKPSGTAWATLDGTRVRMVPRYSNWKREP